MVSYLKNIDRGYPGTMSRTNLGGFILKSEIAGDQPLFFGMAVSINADNVVVPYDTALFVHGFLVRPFPKQGNMTLLGDANPSFPGEVVTVMLKGFMTVNADTSTITPGVPVFAMPYDSSGATTTTVTATGTTGAVPGAKFTGVSTGGITEIELGMSS